MGSLFDAFCSSFANMWTPRQNLLIDEGCIAFKGCIHFKCYNSSKIDKYHLKTYKLVDSSNNYCCKFELYCGKEEQDTHKKTEFGITHDLVFRLLDGYLGAGYNVFMDNCYSSPILFYNLRLVGVSACGTSRNRVGLPPSFKTGKLKEKGDKLVSTLSSKLVAMKYFDRKPVLLISNRYTSKVTPTGKRHWKTKDVVQKPEMIVKYNKYMGGVDCNDQLLQYSGFNRRSLKWRKKYFLE